MSDESQGSRIPPPAFPPGSRKQVSNNNRNTPSAESMGDGFISPDEPIPERHDKVGEAFISPDEPLPERHEHPAGELEEFEEEGGVVTGMDLDEHTSPEDMMAAGDPHVAELARKVGKLAEALKSKGEAGLRTSPDMDKFESTLRGYCVGYLAGRRAQDDPSGREY